MLQSVLNVCSYLSSRCAQVCPVNACQPDLNRKESSEQLFKKWLMLHPNDDIAKYLSNKYGTDNKKVGGE
jgi:hypothetical protein